MQYYLLVQMTVRDALNSALDEEMSADPSVFMMGEEVSLGINLFCTSSFSCPVVYFVNSCSLVVGWRVSRCLQGV
jgi:hypothetical protein